MSFFKQMVLMTAMLTLAAAQDLAETSGKTMVEGRRKKRFYKFLFKALGPIMSTLTTVILVKVKLVLVALFFAGIFFFGHKIFPGGFFGSSIISETPPPFVVSSPYTGYHASDHELISSYPGPEPFSSYGHPEASSSSVSFSSYDPSPSGTVSYPPYTKFKGGSRRKRDVDEGQVYGDAALDDDNDELGDNEMYWTDTLTDMTFRFLGVNQRVCRKRFVCEFDFHARRNPILLFVTRAIGRDIFHNYRDTSDENAASYKDCGRIYEDCHVPKRKKVARRPFVRFPFKSQRIPPNSTPEPVSSATVDTQDNEIDSFVESTTAFIVNPARGKLILQPKRSNLFRPN